MPCAVVGSSLGALVALASLFLEPDHVPTLGERATRLRAQPVLVVARATTHKDAAALRVKATIWITCVLQRAPGFHQK